MFPEMMQFHIRIAPWSAFSPPEPKGALTHKCIVSTSIILMSTMDKCLYCQAMAIARLCDMAHANSMDEYVLH